MSAEIIANAVRNRLEIEFVYDGQPRVVRSAAVGIHKDTGNSVLRGYQVGGRSNTRLTPLWDLFIVGKCSELFVTDRLYAEDPPGYRRGDKHMRVIAAEL